jgi:hypothetical protein
VTRRSNRRANRHGHARRADSHSDQPSWYRRVRPLLQRRSTQAALIFSVLLFAYLANGGILPGQDATANVRLAGKVVSKRKLVFTPENEPFMFRWRLKTSEGDQPATFPTWESRYQGESIRQIFERGDLTNPEPLYYLMPTRFSGLYVNRYGLGAGFFAVPFVAAVYPFAPDLYDHRPSVLLWYTAKVAAASAVAGSAVFLFLAALAFMRPSTAAWLALAYGLGTCVWSSSSQTLWQHGPTEFFLALGTFLLLRENRSRSAPWVGLSYALAFACRPTGAVVVAAVGIYYLLRERRAFLGFSLGCLPVVALIATYNLHYFGKLVVLGQLGAWDDVVAAFSVPAAYAAAASTTREFGTSLATGLSGILISPSRGLLVFSPAVGFAFWGLVRAWRNRTFSMLRPVSIAALAMCVVVARWYGWWGGWCYGYRLLVDQVTLLAFFAIPVAEEIRRRRILLAAFAVCGLWGVTVQGLGAMAYDVVGWNNRDLLEVDAQGESPRLFTDAGEAQRDAWARGGSVRKVPVDVDTRQGNARLWSVRDSQILYYFGHFREARALKQKAIEQFLRNNG